jgi:hypothetical protein
LPRNNLAISEARRPRVCPAASTTHHWRAEAASSALGLNVFTLQLLFTSLIHSFVSTATSILAIFHSPVATTDALLFQSPTVTVGALLF